VTGNIGRIRRRILRRKADPPEFVGYEHLVSFIRDQRLLDLDGDLVEIGAYMGGGTVKLARLASRHGRNLYVIDTFDPAHDRTVSRSSVSASEVYEAFLEGRSMWDVYRDATRRFDNIVTIRQDSREVEFDERKRFVFGFVDGCHSRDCVESDFRLIWPRLVSGGVLGFHDYHYDDWPEVTEAVDHLMAEHSAEIGKVHEIVGSYRISSILLTRK